MPTDEWQNVADGQAIPPGLWVRMDLSTGAKSARLLPEEERTETAAGAEGTAGREERSHGEEESTATGARTSAAPSSGALSVISPPLPSSSPFPSPSDAVSAPRDAADEAPLFAAAFAALSPREQSARLSPLSDGELSVLLMSLSILGRGNASAAEIVASMEALEEVVHSAEAAMAWVWLGGLDAALGALQGTGETDSGAIVADPSALQSACDVRAAALLVLGSAASNHDAVRREALNASAIVAVLDTLDRASAAASALNASASAATAQSNASAAELSASLHFAVGRVQARAVYALSSVLRSSTQAQSTFFALGGEERLAALLLQSSASMSGSSLSTQQPHAQQRRVYGKALELLADLVHDQLVEREGATGFHHLTRPHACPIYAHAARTAQRLTASAILPASEVDGQHPQQQQRVAQVHSAQLHALSVVHVTLELLQLLASYSHCESDIASSDAVPRIDADLHRAMREESNRAAAYGDAADDEGHHSRLFHYTRLTEHTERMLRGR